METYTDAELDLLYANGLLCAVCEQQPAAVQARFLACAVCADCAASEPEPETDPEIWNERRVVLLTSESGTYREWDVTVAGTRYCVIDEDGTWTLMVQGEDKSWQDTDEDVDLWLEAQKLVLST